MLKAKTVNSSIFKLIDQFNKLIKVLTPSLCPSISSKCLLLAYLLLPSIIIPILFGIFAPFLNMLDKAEHQYSFIFENNEEKDILYNFKIIDYFFEKYG